MTRVTFHFGADDKWHYASRLLRKASQSGAKVVVVADAADVVRVDNELWALAPTEFVAHCVGTAAESVLRRSGIVIAPLEASGPPPGKVLLNLGQDVPSGVDDFDRLIEVVSTDDAERHQARVRWKRYAAMGFTIEKHDIQSQGVR